MIGTQRLKSRTCSALYNTRVRESPERRWIEGWTAAGPELQEQRRRELSAMSPERGLFLSEAALSLVGTVELPERRRTHSGLVDLQDLFGRLRSR